MKQSVFLCIFLRKLIFPCWIKYHT